jgi:hypothetical protein
LPNTVDVPQPEEQPLPACMSGNTPYRTCFELKRLDVVPWYAQNPPAWQLLLPPCEIVFPGGKKII